MIHYQLSHQTHILFVGINPHPGSAKRGIPYSNNKMFWYLLADAGLIHESREDLKNDASLKKIYLHKFTSVYHLGIIGMIDRPTRSITELKRGEENLGRKRLLAAVKRYQPSIVCFVGKTTYERFSGSSAFTFGWQAPINSSRVYVMHDPHHGAAIVRIKELKRIKKAAAKIHKKL